MIHVHLIFDLAVGDKTLVCIGAKSISFLPFLGLPYVDEDFADALQVRRRSCGFYVSSVSWKVLCMGDLLKVRLDATEETHDLLASIDLDKAAELINKMKNWEAQVLS